MDKILGRLLTLAYFTALLLLTPPVTASPTQASSTFQTYAPAHVAAPFAELGPICELSAPPAPANISSEIQPESSASFHPHCSNWMPNEVCEPWAGEDCDTCPQDCGCQLPATCTYSDDGQYICMNCGYGGCEPSYGETCFTCVADCGCIEGMHCDYDSCISSSCYNNICESQYGENCYTCEDDCGCSEDEYCNGSTGECDPICDNDSTCDAPHENCSTCPSDCSCPGYTECIDGLCQICNNNYQCADGGMLYENCTNCADCLCDPFYEYCDTTSLTCQECEQECTENFECGEMRNSCNNYIDCGDCPEHESCVETAYGNYCIPDPPHSSTSAISVEASRTGKYEE